MTILITGGAGFIGSHLTEALLDKGYNVIVLDDLSSGKRDNLPLHHKNMTFIEGDIRDPKALAPHLKNVDMVFHLAACVSVQKSIDAPDFSKSINIDGFFNVLHHAQKAGVKKFIHASSAAVYGDPQTFPIRETDPTQPTSPYGLEKLVGEEYLHLYAKMHQLDYIAARFFNVHGTRQDPKSPYSGVISIFEDRAKAGKELVIFGDGKQTRDFIHVSDVVSHLIALAFSKEKGVFNIGTGTETTLTQLAESICKKHNLPSDKIKYADARLGDIVRSVADITKLKNASCKA